MDTRAGHTLLIIRRVLLLAFIGGVLGNGIELLLIGHTEEWTQLLPLVLFGLGLVAAALVWLRPTRTALQLFAGLAGLFIGAGLLGLVLHYRGNAAFELEMRPALDGLELIRESITGATPALAPGSMILLGVVGWLVTFRHPALAQANADEPRSRTEAT